VSKVNNVIKAMWTIITIQYRVFQVLKIGGWSISLVVLCFFFIT